MKEGHSNWRDTLDEKCWLDMKERYEDYVW